MTITARLTPTDITGYLETVEQDRVLARQLARSLFRDRRDPALRDYLNAHGLRIALHACGFTEKSLDQVIARHKSNALYILSEDPFDLIGHVKGLTFARAVGLWRRLAPNRSDKSRYAIAAIQHSIASRRESGDVWIDAEALKNEIRSLTLLTASEIDAALQYLISQGVIVAHTAGLQTRLVRADALSIEKSIAFQLRQRIAPEEPLDHFTILDAMVRVGLSNPDDSQINAVDVALSNRVSLITGGPGTGKSTILKAIATLLREQKPDRRIRLVSLAARVARAVGAKTGITADTIHATLGVEPGFGYAYGPHNRLHVDVLIIEEAFMIGNLLMADLLAAVPPHARIIIVGDPEQLPPVMEGKPVEAVLLSGVVPTAQLTTNHRSEARDIPAAAKRIMKGRSLTTTENVRLVSVRQVVDAISIITDEFNRARQIPGQSVQILTAMHEGALGTAAINRAIAGRDRIAVGDVVMQTVNDRERDIYNGELGIVVADNGLILTVEKDDGALIDYDRIQAKQLTQAWAITYHKSQGLEYDTVILVVSRQHQRMLGRNLINVGMTRAKRRCVIVDHGNALEHGLSTDQTARRTTLLTDLMKGIDIGLPHTGPPHHAALP